MALLSCGRDVLAVAVLTTVMTFSSPATHALFVDRDSPVRQVILGNMTSIERRHYFGNGSDPVFYLARPRLIPANVAQQVRLTISSGDFHLDSVLASAEDLLADHLLEEITVNGHTINLQHCHFRASNATHVISVNNCDGHGLNGTYGVHILHLAPKRTVGGGRAKREAMRGLDEELCATGPEHDVSALFRGEDPGNYRRPPKFRDVTELIGDLDLQNIEDTQDAHLEDHNHTVTANPVSAVLRRTVELGVFCDSDLYRNFPLKFDGNRESQVSNYVLTIINAVQGIYHQQELEGYVVDLRLVEMEILTESNSRNNPSSSGGDIGAYLNSFCAWQQNMNPGDDTNPKHWDHALMLSGLDLHSSGNPSVIGLAWVSGMCSPSHSCTMNEGLDFSSVYVVAHEMGHNFGMNHDGQGDASACSSTSYIMSPSVGPGKTTWSTCSARVLHSFLSKSSCLDDGKGRAGRVHEDTDKEDHRIKHYLREGMLKADRKAHEVKLESLLRLTPGYQFPLTEQCKAMYGRDYHPALTKEDLCKYLYCTNGVVTRPAHPALEGSFCGSHRVCIAGKCRQEEELVNLLAYNIPSPDEPSEQQSEPSSLEEDLSSSSTASPPVSSTSSTMEICSEESESEGKQKYDSKELPLNLLESSLQEYVGQKDRFLPLNAPEAMPRTKVGKCSVTCGRGVRIVEQECVDVHTEEVLDSDSCQGYIVPKPAIEECVLPDCLLPRWKIEEWGACQQCGTGVQFRQVQCTIPILESQAAEDGTGQEVNNINLVASPVLVVEDKQCEGERPPNVQECHKICTGELEAPEDSIEIAKDFDY
ncbi:hypothetical protein O3P69_020690 [Scylla paramamosain]|uniref:Peptidase M12B domain-containing protein n=1 Tax=Scylla paramamosain TaxID=85552 RepID=A0AAW0TN10_SCYPA